MSKRRLDQLEASMNGNNNSDEIPTDANPTTKLERRRRIEDLFEEKRMREELGEFDLL